MVVFWAHNPLQHTVCPRRIDSFYIVSYLIKTIKTFWTFKGTASQKLSFNTENCTLVGHYYKRMRSAKPQIKRKVWAKKDSGSSQKKIGPGPWGKLDSTLRKNRIRIQPSGKFGFGSGPFTMVVQNSLNSSSSAIMNMFVLI